MSRCGCFKLLFIWKFILSSSPQDHLFFLCHMLTVLGLDRARQKCPSELCLQGQLLLVQSDRRSPLSSTGWKPESQLCNLSLRYSSCWLSFFGKWRDHFAHWCVLWNYCLHTDLTACLGNVITDIPVSWKMAEMICKNGRSLKSLNMSCAFSLLWLFHWFMLLTWKMKIFVSLTPVLCHLWGTGRVEASCWMCCCILLVTVCRILLMQYLACSCLK